MAPSAHRPSASARPARVLVVDDSAFMQRRIAELIERDGDLQVVGTARDGADAISQAAALQPDVITMDIHMPRMDGLLAIDHIMRTQPRPIVVVSSFVRSGSAAAIAALDRGAVELVQKPSEGGVSLDLATAGADLLRKVRMAARVRVIRSGGAGLRERVRPVREPAVADAAPSTVAEPETVALIGCSTGGPAALLQLTRQWRGVPLPAIVVAQHLPAEFTTALAEQMAEALGASVREATSGDRPRTGEILIAPGGRHLVFDAAGAVRLLPALAGDTWVPSVDRFLDSAASVFGARALAIVLTGMGSDGTAGAACIRRTGGTVWAQDADSSIIDGMPRAVRESGYASRVLSLSEIGQAIVLRAATQLSP